MLNPPIKGLDHRVGRQFSVEYRALEQLAREHDGDSFIRVRLTAKSIQGLAQRDFKDNALVSVGKVKSAHGKTVMIDAWQIAFLECKVILTPVKDSTNVSPEYIVAEHRVRQWLYPIVYLPYGPGWRDAMRSVDKDELIEQIKKLSKRLDDNTR